MKFRFETLFQVHKNEENVLQKELGSILAHRQTQQNRHDFIQETSNNAAKQINQRMTQNLKVDTYVLYNSFFEGNRLQKQKQQTIISEIDVRADAKRQELVEARRKRRIMEILKERDLKAEGKRIEKIEIETMNEIASNHWRQIS